jgi:ABC-type phosphate transport system auxiliary subunit
MATSSSQNLQSRAKTPWQKLPRDFGSRLGIATSRGHGLCCFPPEREGEMAEVVERVAHLEGRFDGQAADLTRLHESAVRVEDKMDRGFVAGDATIARLEDKVERRFEAVDAAIAKLDDKVERRFEAADAAIAKLDDKFERRFEAVDAAIAKLDDKFERRFEAVDGRFVRLEGRLERRFEDLETRFDSVRSDLRSDFRWIMGGIAGAVVTVILSMFAKDWL